MSASVIEDESRAGHRLHDRPRCEHFAFTGESGYACANMHRNPAEVVTAYLALSGVNAGSGLQAKFTNTLTDELRAADGTCGAFETCQEAVAGLFDLASSEVRQTVADYVVVTF